MLENRTHTRNWLGVCSTAVGICLGACLLKPSVANDQPAAAPASGFRLPALLKRLGSTTPTTKTVPSDAVVDELRELYRQNGLAMPPMTLEALDRRQQGLVEPATVEPIQHSTPAAVPPAPAVEFTPRPVAEPSLIPAPTPNPTHVQAIVKQHRQHQQITGRAQRGGLKGFCPVALRDRCELVDARPEFNVAHKGRRILFSSQAACAAFLTQPSAYLPVAKGIDLVSISQRRPRMGQLDHATWYRGRLFLFATKANLIEFQKQPDRFTP